MNRRRCKKLEQYRRNIKIFRNSIYITFTLFPRKILFHPLCVICLFVYQFFFNYSKSLWSLETCISAGSVTFLSAWVIFHGDVQPYDAKADNPVPTWTQESLKIKPQLLYRCTHANMQILIEKSEREELTVEVSCYCPGARSLFDRFRISVHHHASVSAVVCKEQLRK